MYRTVFLSVGPASLILYCHILTLHILRISYLLYTGSTFQPRPRSTVVRLKFSVFCKKLPHFFIFTHESVYFHHFCVDDPRKGNDVRLLANFRNIFIELEFLIINPLFLSQLSGTIKSMILVIYVSSSMWSWWACIRVRYEINCLHAESCLGLINS